jgi:hypothetical protein
MESSKSTFDKRQARNWRPTDFALCMMVLVAFVALPQFSINSRAAERFIETVAGINQTFAFQDFGHTDEKDLVENRTEQVVKYLMTKVSKLENEKNTGDKFCRFNLRCSDLKFNKMQLSNTSYRFYEPPRPLWGEAALKVRI